MEKNKVERERMYGAVARGWCHERNSSKVFDVDLAKAIVDEVMLIVDDWTAAHAPTPAPPPTERIHKLILEAVDRCSPTSDGERVCLYGNFERFLAEATPTPAPPQAARVRQYENRIPCGKCGHVHLGSCPICNDCAQIEPPEAASPPPAEDGPKAPLHPFEVHIHVGGETWDYVIRQLRDLLDDARRREPGTLQGFGGGGGGSYSITTALRDISPEEFRKELMAWHDALPSLPSIGEGK